MKINKVVMTYVLSMGVLLAGCGNKSELVTEQIAEPEMETETVEAIADNDEQESSNQKNVNSGEINEISSPVTIDMSTTNFSYYLGEVKYMPDTASDGIKQVFGFNMFEEYEEFNSLTTSRYEQPDLVAYTAFDFINQATREYIGVMMPDNIFYNVDYIKNFLNSNEYTVGEKFSINIDEYSLDALEKGETVDTMYGEIQIIYQTATNTFSGKVERSEIALFNVNDHDILIKYKTLEDSTFENGVLAKLLPEMFTQ